MQGKYRRRGGEMKARHLGTQHENAIPNTMRRMLQSHWAIVRRTAFRRHSVPPESPWVIYLDALHVTFWQNRSFFGYGFTTKFWCDIFLYTSMQCSVYWCGPERCKHHPDPDTLHFILYGISERKTFATMICHRHRQLILSSNASWPWSFLVIEPSITTPVD